MKWLNDETIRADGFVKIIWVFLKLVVDVKLVWLFIKAMKGYLYVFKMYRIIFKQCLTFGRLY